MSESEPCKGRCQRAGDCSCGDCGLFAGTVPALSLKRAYARSSRVSHGPSIHSLLVTHHHEPSCCLQRPRVLLSFFFIFPPCSLFFIFFILLFLRLRINARQGQRALRRRTVPLNSPYPFSLPSLPPSPPPLFLRALFFHIFYLFVHRDEEISESDEEGPLIGCSVCETQTTSELVLAAHRRATGHGCFSCRNCAFWAPEIKEIELHYLSDHCFNLLPAYSEADRRYDASVRCPGRPRLFYSHVKGH
jgi:hypothetical protein